jgi:hypothetical protein
MEVSQQQEQASHALSLCRQIKLSRFKKEISIEKKRGFGIHDPDVIDPIVVKEQFFSIHFRCHWQRLQPMEENKTVVANAENRLLRESLLRESLRSRHDESRQSHHDGRQRNFEGH